MSWWTDNRQTILMTVVRWGLGYLLGRTAASDLNPSTQQPLQDDGQQLNDAAQKGDTDNGKKSGTDF